jgi:hypothetical protein
MFKTEIPRTDPDEFSRCGPGQGFPVEGKVGQDDRKGTDAAIAHAVDEALWKDAAFRATDYNNIEVQVVAGIVYLFGHVISSTNKHRAEQALQTIQGIRGVQNHLVPDDRLLAEVAIALGSLESAYECKFFTGVSHGLVLLSGNVSDANVKLLAEKCAASNPDVRGVISSVRAVGTNIEFQDPPFLQPFIGEEIFFLNGISGVVRQVIINPNNRRVAAMTLEGRFEDQRQELRSLNNGHDRSPERLIVISMNQVRYMTRSSGFLSISSDDRAWFMDFDPASFISPNGDWAPPYPYCPEDVLFPVEYSESENQPSAPGGQAPSEVSLPAKSLPGRMVPVAGIAAWEDDGGRFIESTDAVS